MVPVLTAAICKTIIYLSDQVIFKFYHKGIGCHVPGVTCCNTSHTIILHSQNSLVTFLWPE